MCGIFALLNNSEHSEEIIQNEFKKGENRGPEFSKLDNSFNSLILGFHRLAINGLNNESNQPLIIDNVVLICNGEIYNYKQLYKYMNITPKTESDCEAIIHLYIKYGIEQTLTMLDGVYSFILLDNRSPAKNLYVARDPFGVRPLYYLSTKNSSHTNNMFGFASELKCLQYFYNTMPEVYSIEQFEPGTYSKFNLNTESVSESKSLSWNLINKNIRHFIPSFSYSLLINKSNQFVIKSMMENISNHLNSAVIKRCFTTERPIACLLSGGLDSSLITTLVNNYYRKNDKDFQIETYSIGLKDSEDLKYAKIVADYLKTKHTEIIVTEDDMFNAIPEVIYAIESYDTTSVRASIGNYLLGKYIAKNSTAKVIFNGDGSDELFGGYLYMNKCPDDIEFDKETRRLLKDIHLFDVLRSDKSISSHGLEPRTPFLDRTFVNHILTIPPYFRNHKNINECEKYLLRSAFVKENVLNFEKQALLPDEILWRKKEAFSDGVSGHGRSLFQILQDKIALKLDMFSNIETEKHYYKQIFDNAYPNCSHILPYFWMPKYTDATDPSARTLVFYSDDKKS